MKNWIVVYYTGNGNAALKVHAESAHLAVEEAMRLDATMATISVEMITAVIECSADPQVWIDDTNGLIQVELA